MAHATYKSPAEPASQGPEAYSKSMTEIWYTPGLHYTHLDGVGGIVAAVEVWNGHVRTVPGACAVGLTHALQLILGPDRMGWVQLLVDEPGSPLPPTQHC